MKNRLILIGFMGVGKTVVGRQAANAINSEFLDLDEVIEKNTNQTITSIFKVDGEGVFRELEYDALQSSITLEQYVISTGGGIVEFSKSYKLLQDAEQVIWLKASFDTIKNRLNNDDIQSRPLFDETVFDRFNRRQKMYETVANFTVEVDNLTIEEVAEKIINRYG